MGKSSGKVKLPAPGPLEQAQADFLNSQRTGVIEPVQNALMPSALPAAIQGFNTSLAPPDRQTIEAQYKQSGQDIMNQAGGRGGMLRRAMTMNDLGRAETVANAASNARQLGIQRALGLLGPAAFPGANTVIQGGQAAASGEQARRAEAANAAAGSNAGKGSMIGGGLSLAGSLMAMY